MEGLSKETAPADPLVLFAAWFAEAKEAEILLPEAMSLATCTPDGLPSLRMMLLKGFGPGGFVFYTNFESRKAAELTNNPRAAMLLHWKSLQRQVRVEGTVERLSDEESKVYFDSRLRGSRLGAWASHQSSVIASRRQLEQRFDELEQKFAGREIPLPPFWGGYRMKHQRIEFWQGRLNRLHDRLCYILDGDQWTIARLAP